MALQPASVALAPVVQTLSGEELAAKSGGALIASLIIGNVSCARQVSGKNLTE